MYVLNSCISIKENELNIKRLQHRKLQVSFPVTSLKLHQTFRKEMTAIAHEIFKKEEKDETHSSSL